MIYVLNKLVRFSDVRLLLMSEPESVLSCWSSWQNTRRRVGSSIHLTPSLQADNAVIAGLFSENRYTGSQVPPYGVKSLECAISEITNASHRGDSGLVVKTWCQVNFRGRMYIIPFASGTLL